MSFSGSRASGGKRGALSSMCTRTGNNEVTNKLWQNEVKASCSVHVVFHTVPG